MTGWHLTVLVFTSCIVPWAVFLPVMSCTRTPTHLPQFKLQTRLVWLRNQWKYWACIRKMYDNKNNSLLDITTCDCQLWFTRCTFLCYRIETRRWQWMIVTMKTGICPHNSGPKWPVVLVEPAMPWRVIVNVVLLTACTGPMYRQGVPGAGTVLLEHGPASLAVVWRLYRHSGVYSRL